jgi:hypothetical protein
MYMDDLIIMEKNTTRHYDKQNNALCISNNR